MSSQVEARRGHDAQQADRSGHDDQEAGTHRARDHHHAPGQEGDGGGELGEHGRGRPPGQAQHQVADAQEPQADPGGGLAQDEGDPGPGGHGESTQSRDLLHGTVPPPPQQPALDRHGGRAPEEDRLGVALDIPGDQDPHEDRRRRRRQEPEEPTQPGQRRVVVGSHREPTPDQGGGGHAAEGEAARGGEVGPVVGEDQHQPDEGQHPTQIAEGLGHDGDPTGRRMPRLLRRDRRGTGPLVGQDGLGLVRGEEVGGHPPVEVVGERPGRPAGGSRRSRGLGPGRRLRPSRPLDRDDHHDHHQDERHECYHVPTVTFRGGRRQGPRSCRFEPRRPVRTAGAP